MEDINIISKRLEEKVTRVISAWNVTEEENGLLKNAQKSLRREIESYKNELAELHEKTKLIKLANSVAGAENGNSSEVKLKINEFIREIDKCIGLLNE